MTEHIEGLDQAAIDGIFRDCSHHSDEEFLFIPGIEMDFFTVYFLGLEPTAVDFSSERATFDSLRLAAALCILSHPVKAAFSYPEWILDACDGVEILNTKHDGRFYFRRDNERLLQKLRQRKPEAGGLVGMDFHDARQLNDFHFRLHRQGPLQTTFVVGEIAAGRIEPYRGDQPLNRIGPVRRELLRARIVAMDGAHAVNRKLSGAGLRPPRKLRRILSRVLEGD